MMLEQLSLSILEISIASSAVILLLLLLSPLLAKRYAPRLQHLLWLVVAVRLLIPFNLPWENSLRLNLFPTAEMEAAQTQWFLPNPSNVFETNHQGIDGETQVTQKPNRNRTIRITPAQMLVAVWLLGAGVFLLYHTGAYLHTRHKLRRWITPVQDEAILRLLADTKQELSLRQEVSLYTSSKAASPLLMGFIRPCIILPEQTFAVKDLDLMLRHELWHLKRGDLWYKLLFLLANAVHWFNPAVLLMVRQANLETELACDADVLRGADRNVRSAYGHAILSFIEQGWSPRTPLTTRFYGGKTQMVQRFKNIVDTSPKKRGAAFFCAAALVVGLAGCAVKASPSPHATPLAAVPGAAAASVSQPETPTSNTDNISVVSNEIDHIYSQTEWGTEPYIGGEMAWPLPQSNTMLAPYGWNDTVSNLHTGVDIQGAQGVPVIAANSGTVKYVETTWQPGVGYGMYVIVDHGGGVTSLYAHCSEILVAIGDTVEKGQIIAKAGATGDAEESHLHFEVRTNGKHTDPMPYISATEFIWPTDGGYISAGKNAYRGHTGMDIAGPEGTPIYAAASGTVLLAQEDTTGYGKHILIDHGNGYQTLYAQNSALMVKVGDVVKQGQKIAAMGNTGNSTGNHLHFEIRHYDKFLNPEDFVTAPKNDVVME